MEGLLGRLLELLRQEVNASELQEISSGIYVEAATRCKALRPNSGIDEHNLQARLTARERQLMGEAASLLLHTRIRKLWTSQDAEHLAKLTAEERYVAGPLTLFFKRLRAFENALREGQTAFLTHASHVASSQYVVVRYLRSSPAIIGADLAHYGPFKEEDVAVLPMENALALLRQGLVAEISVDDR